MATTIYNTNKQVINIEFNHTLDEWVNKQYPDDVWDFSLEDILSGAIEPDADMIYWLIGNRLYETK